MFQILRQLTPETLVPVGALDAEYVEPTSFAAWASDRGLPEGRYLALPLGFGKVQVFELVEERSLVATETDYVETWTPAPATPDEKLWTPAPVEGS